jgi:proteasome lid subunit RPN8/RPN11
MKEASVHPLVSAGKPRRARIPVHRAYHWLADREDEKTQHMPVFVTQSAFQAINQHANTDLDNEVGGWLAGRWFQDTESGRDYVIVEALLPAQQVRSGSTFLTFTHDSQVAMLAALEERYANKGIVGWYHTHPRMGIFLSGYDLWLHDHFFPHPWQVALVVEPHTHTAGFFVRDGDQQLDGRRYSGFYELQNRKKDCIANWKNMHLAPSGVVKPETRSPQNQPAGRTQAQALDNKPKEVNHVVATKPEAKPAQSEPVPLDHPNPKKNGDTSSEEAAS